MGFHERMFAQWAAKVMALGYTVARLEEARSADTRSDSAQHLPAGPRRPSECDLSSRAQLPAATAVNQCASKAVFRASHADADHNPTS